MTVRKPSHEMRAESSTIVWCLCCRKKPGRLKCSLACRTVILSQQCLLQTLLINIQGASRSLLCSSLQSSQAISSVGSSLAFKSNSSIRDRILSLRLFTQNPAMNYFLGKTLKRAMPGSLSFFWHTSLRKCPEENGRDIALLCALPQLP